MCQYKKTFQLKNLTLYEYLPNWCGYGEIDAEKNTFKWNVRIDQPNNSKEFSNKSVSWLDWIKFKNDNFEYDFCFALSDLKNYN